MRKRLLAGLLSALMLLGCMSSTVWAEGVQLQGSMVLEKYQSPAPTEDLEGLVDTERLRAILCEGAENCDGQILLYDLRIPESQENINEVGLFFLYGIPEIFHVNSIDVFTLNGYIYSINPVYRMEPDEYAECLESAQAGAEKLLEGIVGNDSLGDVEKALLLHDRLAVWCEYDLTLARDNVHNMVGALGNGLAVCQGYAMAYIYLLRQVGVESRYCSSRLLNHGWNIVTVDGVDYHVDVTWDDPTMDRTGRVNHDNFLLSTEGIVATGHHEDGLVDYDIQPSDSRYEDAFWTESNAEFVLLGDEIYYLNNQEGTLCRYSDQQVIASVDDTWFADEFHCWPGTYSYLATAGDRLIYNRSDSVYSFDPETGREEKIWELEDAPGEFFFVYGMTYRDGVLICDLNDSPNFTTQTKELYRLCLPIAGDVNGDGIISGADSVLLLQYLAEWDVEVRNLGADCNGDGLISGADSVLLLQYLAEWDVVLG